MQTSMAEGVLSGRIRHRDLRRLHICANRFGTTVEDELKGRAENIAKNFVRAMAHKEKRWLVPEFAHTKRTVQTPERSDIGLRLEEQLPGMRDEVSWTKISYVKLDAVLIEHSQNLGLDELIRLSERARRSPSLQKMLDMQTAFYVDPEKKIAPLFDIVELIEAEYRGESGAAKALGISRKALEKVKRIANDPAIRTARHGLRLETPHLLQSNIASLEERQAKWGDWIGSG